MVKKRDIYKDLKTKYSTKEILGKHVSRAQNWEEGGKGLPGLYEEPTGKAGGWGIRAGSTGTRYRAEGNFHCSLYLTDRPFLASPLSSREYNPVLKDGVQREYAVYPRLRGL